MAIINGSVAEADDVLNAMGQTLKTQSNLVWNASLIGLSASLEEDFGTFAYATMQTSSGVDTTNSELQYTPYFGATVLDEFANGSTINTGIWTTTGSFGGGVSQTNNYLQLSSRDDTGAGPNAISDGASAPDFNTDCIIFVGATIGGYSSTRHVMISDGTTHVTVISNPNSYNYRIEIDPTGNTATVYSNIQGTGGGSSVDISTLNNALPWRIRFYCREATSNWTYLYVHHVRYLMADTGSADYISTATTMDETITNAILVTSEDTTYGDITYSLSADNGANYEEVTPGEIHRFTNTGTQLKFKAELSTTTGTVPFLYHWACQCNYY